MLQQTASTNATGCFFFSATTHLKQLSASRRCCICLESFSSNELWHCGREVCGNKATNFCPVCRCQHFAKLIADIKFPNWEYQTRNTRINSRRSYQHFACLIFLFSFCQIHIMFDTNHCSMLAEDGWESHGINWDAAWTMYRLDPREHGFADCYKQGGLVSASVVFFEDITWPFLRSMWFEMGTTMVVEGYRLNWRISWDGRTHKIGWKCTRSMQFVVHVYVSFLYYIILQQQQQHAVITMINLNLHLCFKGYPQPSPSPGFLFRLSSTTCRGRNRSEWFRRLFRISLIFT